MTKKKKKNIPELFLNTIVIDVAFYKGFYFNFTIHFILAGDGIQIFTNDGRGKMFIVFIIELWWDTYFGIFVQNRDIYFFLKFLMNLCT